MRKCVIVGGAPISNYDRARSYLRKDDFVIYCDSGLGHLDGLGITPSLIVGDFDSYPLGDARRKIGVVEQSPTDFCEVPAKSCQVKDFVHFQKERRDADFTSKASRIQNRAVPEFIVLPKEKDDTDTLFAAKTGLSKGFREFLILGALGKRMDHSLANLAMLGFLSQKKAKAILVDDYSEIQVICSAESTTVQDHFPYFSLLAVFGTVDGVTISNAKFPIQHATITPYNPYAVSNEPLKGGAVISVKQGNLLLIKDIE